MINFFYQLALLLLAMITLPKFLYQRIRHDKYKRSLLQRFGFGFPDINKGNSKIVWIHAVSVGETRAVAPLAKLIKEQNPNTILIVSNITETGHAEAEKSISFADHHVYLPLDFNLITRPIVKRVAPDLVIVTETDIWYNFLNNAKGEGATIALVNGKVSEKSAKRYGMFPCIAKRLFDLFDVFCVQNRDYSERFICLGIPETKIHVTGNLKFDIEYNQLEEKERDHLKAELGIKDEDHVIVIGSTHDTEEETLLKAIRPLWAKIPHLKIVLVPRHPERFDEAEEIIKSHEIATIRYSQIENKTGKEQIILIDAMGLLRRCYQIADVAIVAGSYTDQVGGHNVLEPCAFSTPVFFGPSMYSQPEMVEVVKRYGAGEQVSSDKLAEVLEETLNDPLVKDAYAAAGEKLTAEVRGATKKTFYILSECFDLF